MNSSSKQRTKKHSKKISARSTEEQKKNAMRAILTDDARERLGRIRVARPELADNLEQQLIMLAQSGRLKSKINDQQLREILAKLLPKKRDITIRKRGI